MNLIFYNHYGTGDLFESREFVKDWMRLAGVSRAQYAHRSFPGIFRDLWQIESIDVTPDMDMRKAVTKRGDTWLVNTWIGARNSQTNPPGDYVIWPGIGCTVDNLYRMHNDYLREAGLPALSRSIPEYLPRLDLIPKECVLDWENKWLGEKRFVLMCNGPTGSNHASNFDFGLLLDHIPECEDTVYLFTEKGAAIPPRRTDVLWTDDITERKSGECDLLQISYLSQYCNVIIGRCSGAQMHTQTWDNWMDESKTQIAFTHHRNGAAFVLHPEQFGLKMKLEWSPASNEQDAAPIIRKVMGI